MKYTLMSSLRGISVTTGRNTVKAEAWRKKKHDRRSNQPEISVEAEEGGNQGANRRRKTYNFHAKLAKPK